MNLKKTISNLKTLFYVAIGVQITLLIAIAFKWITLPLTNISITLERYTLMITLIGIPSALKLFSVIMNKATPTNNISTYKRAFITRFGILFIVASLNIVLYSISANQNFMLLTLISFIAYIFSYPSENYLHPLEEDKKSE